MRLLSEYIKGCHNLLYGQLIVNPRKLEHGFRRIMMFQLSGFYCTRVPQVARRTLRLFGGEGLRGPQALGLGFRVYGYLLDYLEGLEMQKVRVVRLSSFMALWLVRLP